MEGKLFKEKAALEAKYQKLYQPLYTKETTFIEQVVADESDMEGVPPACIFTWMP
ncbi:unnamed protein product [Eruca vesicaria subsp. sativa]|uniref:Uncharacterized protein n=1 Tax=Eruca vesicaria subsp. sativa TaxID=29727 RepID=A0ABC8LLS0_ERUVS|nr:unnamed protein product [Eruca vesicaria subsp. sativa]